MNKTMLEVSVYTTKDDKIAVESPGYGEECQTVVISPEQVEALTKLLHEAKDELVDKKRD